MGKYRYVINSWLTGLAIILVKATKYSGAVYDRKDALLVLRELRSFDVSVVKHWKSRE